MVGVSLRRATPADAQRTIDLIRQVAGEHTYGFFEPDEFRVTAAQQAAYISEFNHRDNSLFLLAEGADGSLLGVTTIVGGTRRRDAHSATLSISVRSAYAGRGIGSAMMRWVLDWAATQSTLKRIGLSVFATNERALEFFRCHGFVIEGRLRSAARVDGAFVDVIVMRLTDFEKR